MAFWGGGKPHLDFESLPNPPGRKGGRHPPGSPHDTCPFQTGQKTVFGGLIFRMRKILRFFFLCLGLFFGDVSRARHESCVRVRVRALGRVCPAAIWAAPSFVGVNSFIITIQRRLCPPAPLHLFSRLIKGPVAIQGHSACPGGRVGLRPFDRVSIQRFVRSLGQQTSGQSQRLFGSR